MKFKVEMLYFMINMNRTKQNVPKPTSFLAWSK